MPLAHLRDHIASKNKTGIKVDSLDIPDFNLG